MHRPRICRIKTVVNETNSIKTIYFKDKKLADNLIPGQFVMIWIPGIDEVPMGISHLGSDGMVSITVEAVGEATEKLCSLKSNDLIGVRGPYGKGFSKLGETNLLIGGGNGMAPLMTAIDRAVEENRSIKVLFGAKNSSKLPFLNHLQKIFRTNPDDLIIATEDGSYGYKGVVTDFLEELVSNNRFDRVLACGPELMLRRIYDFSITRSLPLEVSLERYIKCGVGICGSCCLGPYRICVEGPVFGVDELNKVKGVFGKYTRDSSGKKVMLKK